MKNDKWNNDKFEILINKIKAKENLNLEEYKYLGSKLAQLEKLNTLGVALSYTDVDENFEEFNLKEFVDNNYVFFKSNRELDIIPVERERERETSKHILIEGENLLALEALKNTNTKVDLIYIDPPYNTGKDGFSYNDNRIDTENPFKHSIWLSFMKKRLILAKELLDADGVIFVSIDDNEQAYLKVLMDEIFGSETFQGQIIWVKGNAQSDAKKIQRNHEYILTYSGKKANSILNTINENIITNSKKILSDAFGKFVHAYEIILGGGKNAILNNAPNLGFSVYYNPKTNDIIFDNNYDRDKAKTSNVISEIYIINNDLVSKGYIFILPQKIGDKLRAWTVSYKTIISNKHLYAIVKKGNEFGYTIKRKKYLDSNNSTGIKLQPTKSIIEISSGSGTKNLKEIFDGNSVFLNPKPAKLIRHLLLNFKHGKKDLIILDFFAGSGTTGQVVMQLNHEDGGTRKCILITNNEWSTETKEINENLINKYDENIYYYSLDGSRKNHKLNTKKYPAEGISRKITRERLFRVINNETTQGEKLNLNNVLPGNMWNYLELEYMSKDAKNDDTNFEVLQKSSKLYEDLFNFELDIFKTHIKYKKVS